MFARRSIAPLRAPTPATLFGSGKVEEIAGLCRDLDVDVVVIDDALTPVQQRNLERAWQVKVIDRTGLILEIFARRARTGEGRLQVELARLDYERSRLVRTWTHLERQRGGFGFLGGPGETQIEADRRLLVDRIVKLKRELEEVRRTRGLQRQAPQARAVPDRRPGGLHQRRQVDPVQPPDRGGGAGQGHAVRHPRSHPAPAAPAGRPPGDPLRHGGLHLRPAARTGGGLPRHAGGGARGRRHPACPRHRQPTTATPRARTWARCWARSASARDDGHRILEVWNKIDLLDADARQDLAERARTRGAVALSAATGNGIDTLLDRIASLIDDAPERTFLLGSSDGEALAWLYRHGRVTDRREVGGGGDRHGAPRPPGPGPLRADASRPLRPPGRGIARREL